MSPGEEPIPKPKKNKNYREKILSGERKPFGWGKRKGLRKKSKKAAKSDAEYLIVQQEYLKRVPFCEICGCHDSDSAPYGLSIHHKNKRGKYKCDSSTFMTACVGLNKGALTYLRSRFPDANFSGVDNCHSFIEANKRLSREMGWLS